MLNQSLETKISLDAQWTDDCQGKKDYDGNILAINTRYWPRGGSALFVNLEDNSITDSSDIKRQHIKPSAKSTLVLYYKVDEDSETYDAGSINLIDQEFEGETEEEVKSRVEEWTQKQMNMIVSLLKDKFNIVKQK